MKFMDNIMLANKWKCGVDKLMCVSSFLLVTLILSACATQKKVPVEVYDFPLGAKVANLPQNEAPIKPPTVSGQTPIVQSVATGSKQKQADNVIPIFGWPKVQQLPNNAQNRALIVQDLGDAAASKPISVAAVAPKTVVTSIKKPKLSTVKKGNTNFIWPSNGSILKRFGKNGSKGVELGGNIGDSVLAAADGTVTYTGVGLRGYGKLIVVKHANNYLTVYAHNSKILVKEGQKIKRSQKIAELGDSEADRPKLLFQLRKGKKTLDPQKYLPAR